MRIMYKETSMWESLSCPSIPQPLKKGKYHIDQEIYKEIKHLKWHYLCNNQIYLGKSLKGV